MAETTVFIAYDKVEGNITDLKGQQSKMKTKLEEIQTKIKSITNIAGTWESDAAAAIRAKIEAMTPKFESYNSVVESYITLYNNAAASYSTTERTLTGNAESSFHS